MRFCFTAALCNDFAYLLGVTADLHKNFRMGRSLLRDVEEALRGISTFRRGPARCKIDLRSFKIATCGRWQRLLALGRNPRACFMEFGWKVLLSSA